MKFNKWTLALAAAGIVTAPSLLRADEQKPETVLTALSATTLSGYVDTSMEYNPGGNHGFLPPYAFGGGKANGFNLDVVDLALDKPQDESPWASGYHVELWMGPDANALGTQSGGTVGGDFAIRQAYILLRTPVGNGINWKVGVFDTPIGYEGFSSPSNPNFTHSFGFSIEPAQHTGLLGTYQFCDAFSLSAGVANTYGPVINARATPPNGSASYKTYIVTGTFTAPTNWAWAGGSTLSAGVVNGFNGGAAEGTGADSTSVYVGATVNTPLTALKVGASLDYLDVHDTPGSMFDGDFHGDGSAVSVALYASYQATEKLSLNFRGEYFDDSADALFDASDAGLNRARTACSPDPSCWPRTRCSATRERSAAGRQAPGCPPRP